MLLLLCFTDRGTVQKVIVLPRDDLQTEELVLEEVEVFKVWPILFTPSLSMCPFSDFMYIVFIIWGTK